MKREVLIVLSFIAGSIQVSAQKINTKKVLANAQKQTAVQLDSINAIRQHNPELVAPRTMVDGQLRLVKSGDWTSGFFPGILWYYYDFTRDSKWKKEAERFTSFIEKEKSNANSHDVGFKVYCSFGNAWRLAPDPHYKEVIIDGAKTLVSRFNPKIGLTRSWDLNKDKWQYPVIIDNMMNLELLFAATQLSGDSTYYKVAVTHANTTLKNHFRPDNSSYHVVDYDTITGQAIKKITAQGYADGSAWARGQAWGLYGYTMCYRFTKDPRYLQQAEKIAAFIFSNPNLPADKVPYWDYNAPGIPQEERDASAAAIMASALYELSGYSANKKEYVKKADFILRSLTDHYRSPIGANKGFILLHAVGHKPAKSEIDVPIIYADYYYIEALLRQQHWKKKGTAF